MIVARFLEWVETAPVERRAEAIHLLGRAWLYSDMLPSEAEAAEAAMTVMLDDPSVRVRMALADALCRDPRAPNLIILSLAQDQMDVAEIVLRASPVLYDEDLIDIAATTSTRGQIAIASRPWIAAPLAAALAEIGSSECCLALCENYGAEMTDTIHRRIADRFGTDAAIRDAICDRHDCPIDVRQTLVGKISEALGGLALINGTLSHGHLETVMREARDKATLALAVSVTEDDMIALTDHLRKSGQLTPSLLLRALCTGNIRLFVQALIVLSGLPPKRVYSILADCRGQPFRALLDRAGLPRTTWEAFSVGIDILEQLEQDGYGGDIYRFSRQMLERLPGFDLDMSDDEVRKLFALLRRFAADNARQAVRSMDMQPLLAA